MAQSLRSQQHTVLVVELQDTLLRMADGLETLALETMPKEEAIPQQDTMGEGVGIGCPEFLKA